ncbi:hypothetical protein [Dokdonella sp.]|uniref:hypothetical protein n=1 Tax=Dokdonella sp. TaxID=2291710 RepID=UPI001AFD5A88|nr:hypothetical protein [Dokdonella sp.]MBO9662531.1 hypothetical protein [Dokdonella sp.]
MANSLGFPDRKAKPVAKRSGLGSLLSIVRMRQKGNRRLAIGANASFLNIVRESGGLS